MIKMTMDATTTEASVPDEAVGDMILVVKLWQQAAHSDPGRFGRSERCQADPSRFGAWRNVVAVMVHTT